jgi:hypothetical protein
VSAHRATEFRLFTHDTPQCRNGHRNKIIQLGRNRHVQAATLERRTVAHATRGDDCGRRNCCLRLILRMSDKLITQVHGTEENRCVSCDGFTDTGMYIKGDSYFQEGFLKQLSGVSVADAAKLVGGATGVKTGTVLQGTHTLLYRICAKCVSESDTSLPAPSLLVVGNEVECLTQP